MNKTGQVEVKQNITEFDKGNVVDFVSSFIVGTDTYTGEKYYRPYFMSIALISAIARYLLDGVEFEENDNIYVLTMQNEDIRNEVNRFTENYKEDMEDLHNMIDDAIEFRKQCVIHSTPRIDDEVIEILNLARESIEKEKAVNEAGLVTVQLQNEILKYQNAVNEQFSPEESAELTRKMADSGFDSSKIADVIAEKYFSSDKHVEKLEEVIESDKEKIRDLKQYKAAHDAQNVLNDKQ